MNSDDYAGDDSNKRIIWIDMLRGFCMLLILWFHTEMYYAGYDVTPYSYYVGDALAVFSFFQASCFILIANHLMQTVSCIVCSDGC